MLIEELKEKIESKTIDSSPLVFVGESNFIAKQYISAIANIAQLSIKYLLDPPTKVTSIFDDSVSEVRVYETDKLTSYMYLDNYTYIITKSISKEIAEDYETVVQIPKLENWQIEDYVFTQLSGISEDKLKNLCVSCNYNIYRLNTEIKKLSSFTDKEKNILFDELCDDHMYHDLTQYNIFDMSNAIIRKDKTMIRNLYKQISYIDCEPLGLVTTLYNNFKNILSIQTSPNITAESLNINAKQFWAIKKFNCGYYTKEQLVKILELLTGIDKRLKSGEFIDARQHIDNFMFIDYLITHILAC